MNKEIVATTIIVLSVVIFIGVQVQSARRTVKGVEINICGDQAEATDKTYMHNVDLGKRLVEKTGVSSIYNTKGKSRHWVMSEVYSTNVWEKLKSIPCVELEYAKQRSFQSKEDYYAANIILSDFEKEILGEAIRNIDKILQTRYQLVEIKQGQRHDITVRYYYNIMRCIRLAALKCVVSLMGGAGIE